MTVTVFTPQGIGAELVAVDERIRGAVVRGLRQAARLGHGQVVKEIRGNKPFPVVDLGELLRSPKVENEPFGAVLEVTAPHGIFQEFGTGPAAGNPQFTPPFEVIQDWALRKQRGLRKRKGTRKKTKKGAGSQKGKRRDQPEGPRSPFEVARAQHVRRKSKAGRAAAKAKREAAAQRAAKSMAGAVWTKIRRFGVTPKGYYARASEHFQDHVDERVADAVGKVRS